MAAEAPSVGRKLGGVNPTGVRDRVEAAGAMRDMIDGYQVSLVSNASAVKENFLAAGGRDRG